MSVLVIGSLIVDNTLYVEKIPKAGETTIAKSSLSSLGGKGANQAIAARLAGAQVNFIGCVGDDSEGILYKNHLKDHKISSSSIITSDREPTGSAFISVDAGGENSIVVNPGANHSLTPEHLDKHINLFKKSKIILLQLEIPMETMRYACRLARANGLMILINPSPWNPAFSTDEFPYDVLILNEIEAAQISGTSNMTKSLESFRNFGLDMVVITQGSEPTLFMSQSGEVMKLMPPVVKVTDTVGAGDAFTGALAASLLEGKTFSESIHLANTAGAISVTKAGAQGATPTRKEIESFL
ncbi:MAG: ribokinase [Akkermansiaceae bacterium]|jgi:ribokinase|nr:ribokinase [Akkermansiaceae bacterium]